MVQYFSFNETKKSLSAIPSEYRCGNTVYNNKLTATDVLSVKAALNIWLNMLGDILGPSSEEEGYQLKMYVTTYGFTKAVKAASSLAEGILEGPITADGSVAPYFWHTYAYVSRDVADFGPLPMICTRILSEYGRFNPTMAISYTLQFLLFLERFTLNIVEKDPFEKFIAANHRCKEFNHGGELSHLALLTMVRKAFLEIVPEGSLVYDPEDCTFSSGTTAEGCHSIVEKFKALYGGPRLPYLYDMIYPLPYIVPLAQRVTPHLIAVPKNVNAKRPIAPERAEVCYIGQAYLRALRRSLEKSGSARYINEHDQSINRRLALEGSLTGEWATIDMSSASDSIPKRLLLYIAGSNAGFFLDLMTFRLEVPGHNTIIQHMAYTSGNAVTWLTEACVFLAITRVAASLVDRKLINKIFVYGDDLVVPSCIFVTVCELLESLGFVVNRRKSYGEGVFRESCGIWAINGQDITPTYWPRTYIASKGRLTQVLCTLQHELIRRFPLANEACCSEIKKLVPDMTRSPYGAICDDIWSDEVDPYLSDRIKHYCAYPVRDQEQKISAGDKRLYELVTYTDYLRFGPIYRTGLDELLHTSSPRLDYESLNRPKDIEFVRR